MAEQRGGPPKTPKLHQVPAEEKSLPRVEVRGQRKAGRRQRMKGPLVVKIKEKTRKVSGE